MKRLLLTSLVVMLGLTPVMVLAALVLKAVL